MKARARIAALRPEVRPERLLFGSPHRKASSVPRTRDWAQMLLPDVCVRWAEQRWLLGESAGRKPGRRSGNIKSATIEIIGAPERLCWSGAESGVHLPARISPFDSSLRGAIPRSARYWVYPVIDDKHRDRILDKDTEVSTPSALPARLRTSPAPTGAIRASPVPTGTRSSPARRIRSRNGIANRAMAASG